MEIRLMVVELSEIARLGIRESLNQQSMIRIIGEFSSVSDFLSCFTKATVDVILLSDSIGSKALMSTLQVLTQYPSLKLIVLAADWSNDKIEDVAELGVLGFLCRSDRLLSILPAAIQQVAQGDLYISPVAARVLLLSANSANPLNVRQMQVLKRMAWGNTPQEIAAQLRTSAGAVYAMQHRMRLALGVRTTGQILPEAIRRGWVQVDGQEMSG
jgi:two-component system, NarL family, invasion response regulator UvrY